METKRLKRFAQYARRSLLEQVSAKLGVVLAADSGARRENAEAVRRLEEAVRQQGEEQVVERVAYIWFNRFCALRFMDVNRYSRIGVVSPAPGQFQPEILAEAKMGHIDELMVHDKIQQQIFALLDGKTPSPDPQTEAYRLLVVAVCNYWHQAMPFLFQRIDDYTELLMPDDLLSGNSILAYTREAMTPDACGDVEVIGWLYQFYISEKKDEVFARLKKRKKIWPADIPAATQLFTPHWIVRYLVENSLGRLWMLNRPSSRLAADHMDYYIQPEEPETNFLRIDKPEEIKICDPACGSGHMLTYAFDLLHAIYEEDGYEPSEIPSIILTHNLFGIEIDERAGELAAFALMMKGRERQQRFFRRKVKPNICILQNIEFPSSISFQLSEISDQLKEKLLHDLHLFREADNFGSLLRPQLTSDEIFGIREQLTESWKLKTENLLFDNSIRQQIFKALNQTEYLTFRYHVVIANPPYMGGKGMNGRLKSFAQDNYKNSKSDLFAMFMERNLDLAKQKGSVAMITMQSWMFLSSLEKLRSILLGEDTILSMAHLGPRAFDSIGGEVVQTTAFVLENAHKPDCKGGYVRLVDRNSEAEKEKALLQAIGNSDCGWFHSASTNDFKKIPGSPVAYWVSDKVRNIFDDMPMLEELVIPKQGLATGDNGRFTRSWHEVDYRGLTFNIESYEDSIQPSLKWVPYSKGGGYRKWYGFNEVVVFWENGGLTIREFKDEKGNERSRFRGYDYYFLPAATWGLITSGNFSCRYRDSGYVFDIGGMSAFVKEGYSENLTAMLNTIFSAEVLKIINPTLNYQIGDISKIPLGSKLLEDDRVNHIAKQCIDKSRVDWDSYEISWDFKSLPLLSEQQEKNDNSLSKTYHNLRSHWHQTALQMQQLEEKNNRIFINAYGLQNELDEVVPLNEITLTCNPHYRYGAEECEKGSEKWKELEAKLLQDTMKEFISYAVGCMFGRYSLDKPGLILANQGETLADYLQQVSEPGFLPDDDNVVPLLDGDWFNDDITERFREFLRVTFGEEPYEENLKFLEDGLNIKNKRKYTIRDYFLKEFYPDHVKRYKKRPIYWLFSSPKGSFNALIYMHRYLPDTVSVVLNDYLREFRAKLISEEDNLQRVEASSNISRAEKTRVLKKIEKLEKIINELDSYERDTLYPLATEKIEIDLDAGVKNNYKEFGKALKKVTGLS